MRAFIVGFMLVFGLAIVLIAAGGGRDHTGDTVNSQLWARDVCGTVGSWEGALKDIRKDFQKNNYGARNNDGFTGDSVEDRVTVREAVNRAIIATTETLQRGLKQAGQPDAPQGAKAAATLQAWAQQTETNLRVAQQKIKHDPPGNSRVSGYFQNLAAPVGALARSVLQGRAAFKSVTGLDPALASAFDDANTCKKYTEKAA